MHFKSGLIYSKQKESGRAEGEEKKSLKRETGRTAKTDLVSEYLLWKTSEVQEKQKLYVSTQPHKAGTELILFGVMECLSEDVKKLAVVLFFVWQKASRRPEGYVALSFCFSSRLNRNKLNAGKKTCLLTAEQLSLDLPCSPTLKSTSW